jgi:heme-degrading monooxygenase HmoA
MNSKGNVIEMIRFKVNPARVKEFLAVREQVDQEVQKIDGFLGSELCRLDEDNWIILIRWKDAAKTAAAQTITAQLQSITDWIGIAEQFVSFETAEVVYAMQVK